MNIRQFVSSLLFRGVDFGLSKLPFLGPTLAFPLRLSFPLMAYERFNYETVPKRILVFIYLIAVFFCLVLQAVLAAFEEKLGILDFNFTPFPDDGERILFFDDIFNLVNYTLVVPLYLVAGTGFIISLASLKSRTLPLAQRFQISLDDNQRPVLSGIGLLVAILILFLWTQISYAVDVTQYSDHFFWFHGDTRDGPLTRNGYAYLLINAILASFVILIALLQLQMFRWSRILSKGIKNFVEQGTREEKKVFLTEDNLLKNLLSPFTETAIWVKAFAVSLAINLFTWKWSGVSGGSEELVIGTSTEYDNTWFFRFIFLVYLVLVLWIVSLPRYRLQYAIFKLRSEVDMKEYLDVRAPWLIGWASFIDFILLTFFSFAIFGSNEVYKLGVSLFEG